MRHTTRLTGMAIGGVPVEQIQGEFDYRKIPICRYSYRPSVDMKEETIGCCMHDAAFHECITGKKWNVARNRWEASSTPVVNLVIHKFRWITDERTWIAYAWEPAPGCCNTPLPHSFVPMPTDAHLWQTVYPGLCATDGELYDETENTILRGGVTLYARPRTCEEADLLCRAQLLTTATRAVDSAPAEPQTNTLAEEDWPDMLTIRQAAEYARVTERTIRNWIHRRNGEDNMLSGVIKSGRKISIPRTSLTPWRKPAKATRTPKPTRRKRDTGKRNR